MIEECSRYAGCKSFELKGRDRCEGCGFQHFDKILDAHPSNETLKTLGEAYFGLCSTANRSRGGRKTLDEPVKDQFRRILPKGTEIKGPLETKLTINGEEVSFNPKFDGAFNINEKYIFYEVKGYGDNTNDILSAITAAQLLRTVPEYHDCVYYYIGVNSGKHTNGLQSEDFHDSTRTKIYPYVRWAEKNKFLKFFGIVDIEDLLREVEEIINK